MILTVTPNPLLDYVIHCPTQPKATGHRIRNLKAVVGGKGINVARMLKTLGKPALALGFSGGPNGDKIRSLLSDQGISAKFIRTEAETRVGINLVVDEPRSQMWWLEEGEELQSKEIWEFLDLFRSEAPKAGFIALSGTIPGSKQKDFYQRVLEACQGTRAEIFLDTWGDPLVKAMRPGGFFLKHNRDESRETFSLDPFCDRDRAAWTEKMKNARVWGAMVTDGPNPIFLWDGSTHRYLEPPPVKEVSAVGSGDATMAGLIYGRAEGLDLLAASRWGVACGAGDALQAGPCEAPFPVIKELLARIR